MEAMTKWHFQNRNNFWIKILERKLEVRCCYVLVGEQILTNWEANSGLLQVRWGLHVRRAWADLGGPTVAFGAACQTDLCGPSERPRTVWMVLKFPRLRSPDLQV